MKIVTTPNNILTTPSQPIEKIDKNVLNFIEEMKNTLFKASKPIGVGLAAPQVGKNWRIFITKPYSKSEISIFINPQITWRSETFNKDGGPNRKSRPRAAAKLEGCLSIPGIWGAVKRYQSIKINYKTLDNKEHARGFTGFFATIIQHEMDHLNGRLFPSRVLEQKGKLYKLVKNKEGKEILKELEF